MAMTPRSRDPEGRRRVLAAAALEVIADVGVGKTTHRAIAARAGVPLGATTYYFPTLDDLVAAGLEYAAQQAGEQLHVWAQELGDGQDLAETLPRLVRRYLADRSRALVDYELYLAAARDPDLRPVARVWLDGLRELLIPLTGRENATSVAALLDGAMLQSVVTDEDLDVERLRAALIRLLP